MTRTETDPCVHHNGGVESVGMAGLEVHTEAKSPWDFKAMSQEKVLGGKGS